MASRVTRFGRIVDEAPVAKQNENDVEPGFMDRASVTSEMLNEAADAVLGGVDDALAQGIREIWTRDSSNEVSRQYFTDLVRDNMMSYHSRLGKIPVTVNEVLDSTEVAALADYAREYDISFIQTEGHDHGYYSARRKIDHMILESKFPAGAKYLDIGGSITYHVNKGDRNCVVVAPFSVDGKDMMRATLTRQRLGMIIRNKECTPLQRKMADSILNGEGIYHVSDTAQTVNVKASMSMSCHVYDVPLPDWPKMMERCDVRVHEGCVHFSNNYFYRDEGVIGAGGAYYEIDRKADIFRMRVGESVSPWYEHKWTDYQRYGADQIIDSGTGLYSYKVIERRDDTIFFRILKLGSAAQPNFSQVYRLPDVAMVEVTGFEVAPASSTKPRWLLSSSTLVRKSYLFPQLLWGSMVEHAKDEFQRGTPSLDRMANYYRTLVPRQSINRVTIAGGESVPLEDQPALIVMATAVAYHESMLQQRTIRIRTDAVQRERRMRDENTISKLLNAFVASVIAAGYIVLFPFAEAGKALDKGVGNAFNALVGDMMVKWEPQVRYRTLNMALLTDHAQYDYRIQSVETVDYRSYLRDDLIAGMTDMAHMDSSYARVLLDTCNNTLPPSYRERLTTIAGSRDGASVAAEESRTRASTTRKNQAYAETITDVGTEIDVPVFSHADSNSIRRNDAATVHSFVVNEAPLNWADDVEEQSELFKLSDNQAAVVPPGCRLSGIPVAAVGIKWLKVGQERVRREVLPIQVSSRVIAERRAAIAEAIEECDVEMRCNQYTCARILDEITVNGDIDYRALVARQEEYFSADIWQVKSGYLVKSLAVTRLSVDSGFEYSAVYIHNAPKGVSAFQPVIEEIYKSNDGKTRVHLRLPIDITTHVMVMDALKVYNGPALRATLSDALALDDSAHSYVVVGRHGPAGCGKSTAIVASADLTRSMVVVPGREAAQLLRDRFNKSGKWQSGDVYRVCRSMDSLLVNFASLSPRVVASRDHLYIDEYIMARSGKSYAIAALLGVSDVYAYGDPKQLNHKPRVDTSKSHVDMRSQVIESTFLTYRCAPQIQAAFNYVYGHMVRSCVDYEGEVRLVRKLDEVRWMKDTWLISMVQKDKKELYTQASALRPGGIRVNTTHEVQGQSVDQIVLVNTELRRRSIGDDNFYLYNLEQYALVALSRAKRSFVYVKLADEPDLITEMITRARDTRRVAACSAVHTQGQAIEYV